MGNVTVIKSYALPKLIYHPSKQKLITYKKKIIRKNKADKLKRSILFQENK